MPDVFKLQNKDIEGVVKGAHNFSGHSHNPLAAFIYRPDKVNFVNKDAEEKVILLLRKHPITNIRWVVLSFFMIVLPQFFSAFDFLPFLPANYILVIMLAWYLVVSAYIIEQFLRWFFNVNIVTDERIIEVDFVHLLYREMTDANIDQIQDVTPRVIGGVRTFFNYGDVVIQTAAAIPLITFEAVPDPDRVAKVLREQRVEEEKEKLEGRVR
ncbi:hypothetical protein A2685_02470 [Candidatus Woesebacteria bacterium RIFCSPHIGHO2_01_FULL_37_10]|uniref:DUF304 domain-containing protein n=1 Tax=Candidatus Woesebacteria bacterium RIFCSPHIGHO2_01_FULL_37_10 TaxID=1802489 RepID=A0A1F7XVF2_9BACT|nr:MAG: hypothetical protein A2685_02470 [Candidatus Woesebacteria bacterium RIFCSPHIGHO2_01_FULL_37_10]